MQAFYVHNRMEHHTYQLLSKSIKVKKSILSIAIAALLGTACSSNSNQEEGHEHGADTHQHEATTEEAHGHPHDAEGEHINEQEEFTVEGDSVQADTTAATHQHDGQEEHQH